MSVADLVAVAAAGLAGLFGMLGLFGCLVTLASWAAVARYGRRPDAPALATYPSVTILKPLYGDEPGLTANLASFCRQDYPAPVEVVFGVQRPNDPALEVARRVAADHPGVATQLIVDERRHGANGKVSNLVNMTTAIRHEVVVLADSDMRVAPDYLRRIVEALAVPGTGLVTCLYRGVPTGPLLASRLMAAGIDFHFLPNVLFGLLLGLAKPCFGSTVALRGETLRSIGGFAAFADILADDNAMGQAVRRLGLKVSIPRRPVLEHFCVAEHMGATLRQDLRWSRTIRAVDPSGFAGSIVTNPLPLALIGWLFDGFGLASGMLVLAALVCRGLLQHKVRTFAGASIPLWLGPPRDCLSFAVFVASFRPGPVDWRSQRLAVGIDGTLSTHE